MDIIDLLVSEHREIERVLDGALRLAEHGLAGGHLSAPPFEALVRFAREHADGAHHLKEEGLLFPAMVQKGVSAEVGPVGCMLKEHETFRRFLSLVDEGARRLPGQDPVAREVLLAATQAYALGLKAHIEREDGFVFPLGRQTLLRRELERMSERMDDPHHALEQITRAADVAVEQLLAGLGQAPHPVAERLAVERPSVTDLRSR